MPMKAACHCGAVRFEVTLSDGLRTARRCTCSFCRMRGAVAVSAELGGIRFTCGEDKLTRYTFNSGTAQHFFCSVWHLHAPPAPSNPRQFGVNAACLDGVSPFDFSEVAVLDGVAHSSDAPAGTPA